MGISSNRESDRRLLISSRYHHSASWLAHRALTKNLSATDIQNLAPTDPDLTCPVCSKLLRDATLTPCCSTSFCEDCVTNALIDNDMLCPECETRVKSVEKLKPDEGRRERVKKYIEEMVELSKEEEENEVKKEGETEGQATDEKPAVKESDELFPVVKEEETTVRSSHSCSFRSQLTVSLFADRRSRSPSLPLARRQSFDLSRPSRHHERNRSLRLRYTQPPTRPSFHHSRSRSSAHERRSASPNPPPTATPSSASASDGRHAAAADGNGRKHGNGHA